MNKETCYDPHKNKRPACADKCKKCGNLPAPDGKINVDDNYDPCPVCEPADAGEFVKRMKGNLLSYGPFLAATNAGEGIAGDFSDAITIINDLQAQLKAAEGEAASLKKALEAIQIAEYADEIDKIAEQALKEKEDV